MRLGELLRQRGLITPEELKGSLQEQQRFGGRLGTTLIQLGYVEMDTIALALSEQQGLPAVLRQHVAAVDKKTLALFPTKIVLAHKAIPIGYTLTKPGRVVVASMDPARLPLEELAFAAGRRIEVWIAPEALITECLERYFGVPASANRYVSVKLKARPAASRAAIPVAPASVPKPEPARTSTPAAASLPLPTSRHPGGTPALSPSASITASKAPARGLSLPPPPPPPVAARTLEMPDFPPPSSPSAPRLEVPVDPKGESADVPSARRPIEIAATPAWEADLPVHAPIPEPTPPEPAPIAPDEAAGLVAGARTDQLPPAFPAEDEWDVPTYPSSRPLSQAPLEQAPITAPPDALRPMIDKAEASRLLEVATWKDQVGAALADWLRSTFGCGLVLIVKGDMAIGWKGFFPNAEDLIEAVAIPLTKPSLFTLAFESRSPLRGTPPEEGAKVQDLLWKLLRCDPPSDAVVCPVVLGKRVVNLLYAHMDDGSLVPEEAAEQAAALATEAAAAYARLIGKDREQR
jgi:type IV pilus assembly protein PilB